MRKGAQAKLILKDGTEMSGVIFGSTKAASGEVVFATGMVGYPEALTDPSFAGQIVVFTYPLIGNYGVPKKRRQAVASFFESRKIWAAGVVVQNLSEDTDHASAARSFGDWLEEEGVPGIQGIDTRALTKKLREGGTMLGGITALGTPKVWHDPNAYDTVAEVSCKKPWTYGSGAKRVVLIDCGAKLNIVRELAKRNCTVEVVPWDYDVQTLNYDGVFVSNGPGNPTRAKKTITTLQRLLKGKKPVFGICLGSQLMALAAGARTKKLPYGHRSQNQPCTDTTTGRCYITTQNHGFYVVGETLPRGWREWFKNANDGTNEGIYHERKPFRAVQFHPEARPGPEDTAWLFDDFVRAC